MQQVQVTEKQEFMPVAELKESRPKAGSFRYYLHDNSDAFRFQLIGQLTSAALSDLDGCWRTARSSIAARKVCLDLRELTEADETSRLWLKKFAVEEGAECVIATATFSDLLGNDLGIASRPASVPAGALTFQRRLRRWLQVNLFRRGIGRKADDPSFALARCRKIRFTQEASGRTIG